MTMKIEQLRKEVNGDRTRVVATVIWENLDRPAQDIFFETTAEFATDLHCNPNAFLTACAVPAMRFGEERIALSDPICPELKAGLETVMHSLTSWYGGQRQVISIEAPLQTTVPNLERPARAGCFFSGGVDALTMVHGNRQKFPLEHPGSFKDGILIYGILKGQDEQDPSFRNVTNAILALAKDAGITTIPIYTNIHIHIRDLDPRFIFWKYEYQGSFLAAVGHILSRRLSSVSIASSLDLESLEPYGTHPQIDPNLSSTDLQVHHEDIALSRFAKTKILGDWDAALHHLRVCNHISSYQQGNYNCGECEKCLRTKLSLMILNLLDKTSTFQDKEIPKAQLLKAVAKIRETHVESCYTELIPHLRQLGRSDLVSSIQIGMFILRLKSTLKQLDQLAFNGSFLDLSRRVRGYNEPA
jgi:hypothetical protein